MRTWTRPQRNRLVEAAITTTLAALVVGAWSTALWYVLRAPIP
jgi:hypothetical protein